MRVSRLLTNRRLFILLASVILLIVVAGLTLRDNTRGASWPERVVMDVENVTGGWIYRPLSTVSGFFASLQDLHQMYVDNAELKAEMQNYKSLQAQLADAQAQNTQLSVMLGFKKSVASKMQMVPAHVVGRDPSQWNSEITIDAGRAQGVKENMAVLSIDGSLVGRVEAAGQFSSKVVLITDTQVGDGVSARVQSAPQQPFGIVVGSTQADGELEMQFLSPVAQVNTGDTVVTSEMSDIYPKGVLIGTVVQILRGPGLTQSAFVKPAADLDYLQNVFVVVSKP